MSRICTTGFLSALFGIALLATEPGCQAQSPVAAPSEGPRFEQHMDELNRKLEALRSQLENSLTEMQQLRAEVHTLQEQLKEKTESEQASRDVESLRQGLAQLTDTTEVLQSEVKQHDQTKLESVSKFPVRITGTLLVTSFLNSGATDDPNLPTIALPSTPNTANGSLTATATQTLLGVEATGPHLWGATSSADVSADFWGASASNGYYTPAAGTLRLRTAHARLEWPRQSITMALDRTLLSPVQANSWLTVSEPAFAWSGNLWTWLPQLRYRRSLAPGHRFDLEAGILDVASPAIFNSKGEAIPNSSERSRQPGYEARVSTETSWRDLPVALGASGYYSRKTYSGGHVDSWAGAADWNLPVLPHLALIGEVYRGRSLGGLGGGAFKDYVTSDGTPYGLNAAGGWTQLSYTASPALQANAGFGLDGAFASDLGEGNVLTQQNDYTNMARNQTLLGNVIYRPKTYLLFSAEFRQINSRTITGQAAQDRIFGLVTGYTF